MHQHNVKNKIIIFLVFLFTAELNAQPINELEKAFKKNSSVLLEKFISKYTINSSCFDDTCENISQIVQFVSDEYINRLNASRDEKNEIFTHPVYGKKHLSKRYLIYNSNIKTTITPYDLFEWKVEEKIFNLYTGKRVYRDSILKVLGYEMILKLKPNGVGQGINNFKTPFIKNNGLYEPVLFADEGLKAMKIFVETGRFDKKTSFLAALLSNVSWRKGGQSIHFKNIILNKELSQALILISYNDFIDELFFEKYRGTWRFLEHGRRSINTH